MRRSNRILQWPCIWLVALAITNSGTGLSAEPIRFSGNPASEESHSALQNYSYYAEAAGESVSDITLIGEGSWNPARENAQAVKNEFNDVWIRFDLDNQTNSTKWMLWTYIHWQEHRPAGYCSGNPNFTADDNVPGRPIQFENSRGRAHAFDMTLTGRWCRLYIRVSTPLSKFLSIKVGSPAAFHAENETVEFMNGFLFSCLSVILLLNVLFFLKYKTMAALIYACALALFGVWQGVNFGYIEKFWFFSEFLGIARTAICFAGGCGILLMFFWKRLLFLAAYAPLINRFLNFSIFIAMLLFLASLTPDAPFALISRISKGHFAFIVVLLCGAAWVAARRGFRPAIFSFWGNLCFVFALGAFFAFTTFDFLKGSSDILYIPFAGHLIEALFFLVSLVGRQRLIESIGEEGIIQAALESRRSEKRQMRPSRLARADLEGLRGKIRHAMEVEKLYRNELTLDSLAAHLNIKDKELSEFLNLHMQQSFYQLLNHYRIAEACQALLAHPERKILAIAYDAGYKNLSTFNRAFVEQIGVSPGKYRKSGGAGPPA